MLYVNPHPQDGQKEPQETHNHTLQFPKGWPGSQETYNHIFQSHSIGSWDSAVLVQACISNTWETETEGLPQTQE